MARQSMPRRKIGFGFEGAPNVLKDSVAAAFEVVRQHVLLAAGRTNKANHRCSAAANVLLALFFGQLQTTRL